MIIGQMAISGTFLMWQICLKELLSHCDKIYIRLDISKNENKEIFDYIIKICGNKLGDVLQSSSSFHKWHWREDLIKMIPDNTPSDTVIISIDEDEVLDDSIDLEIKQFQKSDKKVMMIGFNPMPTEDGTIILNNKPYPLYPHCKIFKWVKGLTYERYHGNALPPIYNNSKLWWRAFSKITHYCFYKKKWTEEKVKNMRIYSLPNYFKTYYGTTLYGFDT